MRKIISIIISVSVLLCIAGCSQSSENKKKQTGAKQEKTSALAQNNDGIDLDLTQLSSTMVYSEVYNMMEAPEKYVGKKVKMAGNFAVYTDAENNKNYYACLISDATACCAQGIEFEWKGEHTFPDDYPDENTEISVIGVFETYEENGYSYCRLKDAEMTF